MVKRPAELPKTVLEHETPQLDEKSDFVHALNVTMHEASLRHAWRHVLRRAYLVALVNQVLTAVTACVSHAAIGINNKPIRDASLLVPRANKHSVC